MLSWLADQMIEEAMKRGEFDDLPGKGKPLELDDLSHVPAELRSAYKIMKNANIVPEELTLRQEMLTLSDLIAACQHDEERHQLRKKLDEKTLRLHMLNAQQDWSNNSAYGRYESKIRQRLTGW
ncbi:DnaJ family domain-containing protein [Paenibacillus wenxiniae]|uniref:DnaJ family domain-containing protein n=1 Tax=Paenibacillus wenxiniae TaxID=1636843 RepID=A0ABW4RP88_9BACL